jgi:cystathionine gamma-synthase
VESLIAHPATMTHAAMDPEARRAAGLTDGLLRLSIGIEDLDDLRADLRAGFERVRAAGIGGSELAQDRLARIAGR